MELLHDRARGEEEELLPRLCQVRGPVVNGEPALEIDTHVHGPVSVVGDFRGLGGGAPEVSGRLVVANWEIWSHQDRGSFE